MAAHNVQADPRVSVLFEVEQDRFPRRFLRISGQASVRTDRKAQRSYDLRVARKYLLSPGGIRRSLAHLRQRSLMYCYHAQSASMESCIIEVIPKHAEFLVANDRIK